MPNKSLTKPTKDPNSIKNLKKQIVKTISEEIFNETKKDFQKQKNFQTQIEEIKSKLTKANTAKREMENLLIETVKANNKEKFRDYVNTICWIICFILLILQMIGK
jgi:uncharacterized protein YaaN involved in tellurite resistance